MGNIMLSIITPSFNSEKTIRQTMESVLNQSYPDYEYIIMDGGSTDGTIKLIEEFIPRFQGKMRYFSEPDNGIYDAMNKGIRNAKGMIVGIINSDDYYEPGCFECVAESVDKDHKYQIIYGAMRTINENGEELAVSLQHHRNIANGTINHPSVFVSRAVYNDKMMYSTKYHYSSDYEFLISATEDKDILMTPVHDILSNFRTGGASKSNRAAIEANEIQYRHGCITKKKYYLVKTKLMVKQILS